MVDWFVIIGYVGAVGTLFSSFWHVLRYMMGKDLSTGWIDLIVYYISFLLLLIYAFYTSSWPFVIYIAGAFASIGVGSLKRKSR